MAAPGYKAAAALEAAWVPDLVRSVPARDTIELVNSSGWYWVKVLYQRCNLANSEIAQEMVEAVDVLARMDET